MLAMFGLGTGEIIIIALVVLLLFGATRLPSLLGGLGKGMREFKEGFKGESETGVDTGTGTVEQVNLADLRPAVGKHVRLLPDGTLEVGSAEGATMVEVDASTMTIQDNSNVNKIPIGSVKKIVHIS